MQNEKRDELIWKSICEANRDRNLRGTAVAGMFDGIPPYTPEQLREIKKPLRANRGILTERKFEGENEFQAYKSACAFVKESGYSFGPADESDPIALVKGVVPVEAWNQLSTFEIMRTDGNMWVLDGGNYKDGPVFVTLFA